MATSPRSPRPARKSPAPKPSRAERERVCVLAIGGLDPGGGAGILADVRAIARAEAFGCAAAAVLTVQSTSGLRSATPVRTAELLAQCGEVLKHQRVRAIKLGALGSAENARALGDWLAIHRVVPAVVDTVMIPTRGRARLLEERAVSALRSRVIPRAALVTANAPEAEVLTGKRVTRLDEAREAALALLALGARAVLVKGGHLGGAHATDILAIAAPHHDAPAARRRAADDAQILELTAKRLPLPAFHGGGCALASLCAGRLATHAGDYEADPAAAIRDAVRWAKRVHHDALGRTVDVGGDLRVVIP